MHKYKKIIGLFIVLAVVCFSSGCTREEEQKKSNGNVENPRKISGKYLGQTLPGDEPELFAPGFINRGLYTRDIALMPSGDELYFTISFGNFTYSAIMVTREIDGEWTEPQVAPFVDLDYLNIEPFISPDGKKLFFLSNRPLENEEENKKNADIWVVDRTENGWTEPYNLGAPVNTDDDEFFPSVTADGTIYFSRSPKSRRPTHIYRSRLVDGKYQEPEQLPDTVQVGRSRFNSFISPDESYMIFCSYGHDNSLGSTDYYISFRNEKDEWTTPLNLGKRINTADGTEYSPYVSPDGKVFFYMSSRVNDNNFVGEEKILLKDIQRFTTLPGNGNACIYWISTDFIEKLKIEAYK